MDNLVVRPVALADLAPLSEIDHSYHTDYVWQMDLNSQKGDIAVNFREVRLPRSMRVDYPRDITYLLEGWEDRPGLLVAELEQETVGYIHLAAGDNKNLINILDIVVMRRLRKHGIGTALIQAGQAWSLQQQATHLIFGMQSKNHPAISLVNKLGFEFCGYNDHYFVNQDIALFFAKRI